MNRTAACYLTLIILLAACSPDAKNFSTGTPLAAASQPVVPTLTATSVPQTTMTATSIPCEGSQKTSLKIMPLGDSITYGDDAPNYGGYRNLLGTLLTSDGYSIDFVGSQQGGEMVLIPIMKVIRAGESRI